jgi:hypothetical protein
MQNIAADERREAERLGNNPSNQNEQRLPPANEGSDTLKGMDDDYDDFVSLLNIDFVILR